ncbi:MAG: oligosaccharide flippase family protein [Rikenellaceae bacterium]|nr:oligosaccharide flippase family protein [Rikenellaceae bacterium]
MTTVESHSQTRKNLISNIIALIANLSIGLFYTPYLVRNLGIVAYGILPLVLIINQYINVLTGSLTSSLTRFYSIALQQGKISEASKCISTALAVIFIFFVLLIIPLYFIVSRIDSIFTIPPELVVSARILFILTITAFFISLVSSIFNITLYANNRLDQLNVIKIIRVALKLGFVVLLFTTISENIVYVGYANLLTEIIVLIFSLSVFKKFTANKIKINLGRFDKTILLSMLGMTTWVLLVQVGDTGLYRIDNVVVNIFWSTTESGIVGAYSELGSYLMVSLAVFSSIFGPLILMAYSKNRHEELVQMAIDRSLIVGVLAAVATGLVVGFAGQVTVWWLGEDFKPYSTWLILKIILIPYYTSSGVFAFIYRAWNKVKIPAIICIFLGGVNLIIAIIVARIMSPSYTAILIILGSGSLLGILQSYIMNGWYVSRIYPEMKYPVSKNFFLIGLVLLAVSLFSYSVNLLFPYDGIIKFLVVGIIAAGISFAATFRLVFSRDQRAYLYSMIKVRRST